MMRNWWRALAAAFTNGMNRRIRRRSLRTRRIHPLKVEFLEDRLTPAVDITAFNVASGTVTFTGDIGGPSADDLILSESGGFLSHNLQVIGGTGNYASSTDVDPGPGVASIAIGSGATPLITVQLLSLNDSLTF